MAKYKIVKKFRDTHTKELHLVGDEVEFDDDRAKEIAENLKGKGVFIEVVEENPEEGNEEVADVEKEAPKTTPKRNAKKG